MGAMRESRMSFIDQYNAIRDDVPDPPGPRDFRVAEFADACLVVDPKGETTASALFAAYREWASRVGMEQPARNMSVLGRWAT
jgi:hypothetical protein